MNYKPTFVILFGSTNYLVTNILWYYNRTITKLIIVFQSKVIIIQTAKDMMNIKDLYDL